MKSRAPALLLATLLLSACLPLLPGGDGTARPSSEVSSPGETATPSPTALPTLGIEADEMRGTELLVWHAFAGPAAGLIAEQVARFNAANSWGLAVTAVGYADYHELSERLAFARETGETLPDLVAALPEQVLEWNEAGLVADLYPYALDPLWGLGAEALADIPASLLAQDQVDGRLLGLPAERTARLLIYNQSWGRELGFERPPGTADQFREQACAANASFRTDSDLTNDGYGGWIVASDWQTAYSWVLAFGGNVLDEPGYRFRTDQTLSALQFLKQLYDDHCAWLSAEDAPYGTFAHRQALFLSADLAELEVLANQMEQQGSPDEWTVLPFPGQGGSALLAYGPSYSLLASTPARQLAGWLLVRSLLGPEEQALWVEATGLLPLRLSTLEMIAPYRAARPQWEAAAALLPQAAHIPQRSSWGRVRFLLADGTTVIFRMGTPVGLIPGILADMDAMAEELER